MPDSSSASAPDEAGSQALADALRSSFAIVRILMGALVVLFLFSGCFTVGTQEKAVVLRFGKPLGEGDKALLSPGLHWAWPAPIDEVVKIPIGQLQTVSSTIGWYATTAANEAMGSEFSTRPGLDPNVDGYFLTADENIIHVRGALVYRINEPGLRWAFAFVNSSNMVQNAFNNALLYAAAGFKVDDILTHDVAGFRDRVRARLDQLIGQYQLGITVDQVNLERKPPLKLTKDFDRVTEAVVQRDKVLITAQSYENQTISTARADARKRINVGERDRNYLVKTVQAEADLFQKLLPQYEANPTLFVQQRQNEMLQRVFTNSQVRVIVPRRPDGKPQLMRIQITPGQGPVIKPVEPPPPPPAADNH